MRDMITVWRDVGVLVDAMQPKIVARGGRPTGRQSTEDAGGDARDIADRGTRP
jgi:hypothetical protein